MPSIEHKFKIGDEIFFFNDDKLYRRNIKRIEYFSSTIYYTVLIKKAFTMLDKEEELQIEEEKCFNSPDELIEYYKKHINKDV